MAHHKHTASSPACASHLSCEFKRKWPLQWHAPYLFHIVQNLHKNPMSHIERLHALPPPFLHANRPLQTAPWWGLPALSIGKPQLPCGSLFLDPWDIFLIHLSLKVQKTWPRLKATSLGHKAIVLHLVRGNNMIWLGPQSQLLTFHPRHKYYLAWYLCPLNIHCCKAPPKFFSGSSALTLVAILMIPAITSINFGNLSLVFTTRFWNPT